MAQNKIKISEVPNLLGPQKGALAPLFYLGVPQGDADLQTSPWLTPATPGVLYSRQSIRLFACCHFRILAAGCCGEFATSQHLRIFQQNHLGEDARFDSHEWVLVLFKFGTVICHDWNAQLRPPGCKSNAGSLCMNESGLSSFSACKCYLPT